MQFRNQLAQAAPSIPGYPISGSQEQGQTFPVVAPTSLAERILLVILTALLPVQDQFKILGQFSAPTIVMAVCVLVILVNRPHVIGRVWHSPVLLALFGLLYVGALIESMHPEARLEDLSRISQMALGAVVIAAMCRDQRAIRSAFFGFVTGSLILATLIFMTSYGKLSVADASDFKDASKARQEAFVDSPLQANLNTMAFGAAQGAVLTLSFALTAKTFLRRVFHLGLSVFCLVAAFLPVSRSGIIIALASCALIFFAYRGRNKIALVVLLAGILGGAIVLFVPGVVFSRLSYTTEETNGKQEARAKIYTSAIGNLPDYITYGVGAGNFWSKWGRSHGFGKGEGTLGAHNCFFQISIYWGAPALLLMLTVIWCAFRALPMAENDMRLALRGLAISACLYMFVMHLLYSKQFSLALGIIVGARQWVWPSASISRKSLSVPETPRYLGSGS